MMKKVLMLSAIAAMAFGAQAEVDYRVEINNIDKGSERLSPGWIPAQISLALVDSSRGSASAPYNVFSDNINFYTLLSDSQMQDSGYYNAQYGLVNVGQLFADRPTGATRVEFTTANNRTLVLNDGVENLTLVVAQKYNDEDVFPGVSGAQAAADYADKNLRTVLSAKIGDEWETYKLRAKYNTGGGTQVGTTMQLSAVPEPTSSMLVFLGFAGLMLKRRRAA